MKEVSKKNQQLLAERLYETTLELEKKKEEMNTITNNVPGGIFSCFFDDKLTLIQMSDGFLSLVGYTREEIFEKFQNSFMEMIYPEDRVTSMNEVLQQLEKSNSKEVKYRILHKDGHPIWVFDKGQLIIDEHNIKSFCCILVDFTQDIENQESLQLSLERHKIIMNQTNDIIFEWDIFGDFLILSANWEKKFGYLPAIKNNHVCLFDHEKKIFHPLDLLKLKTSMNEIRNGRTYVEIEIRIKNSENHYVWCRIRITSQINKQGVPMKAIGVIIDIDREKKESEDLLKKAEQDALTGMYNKVTSQNMIRNHLLTCSKKDTSAMMIIDIDNFKTINDTYGHLFGDAVLAEVSREIKKIFCKNDIVGRIGGDEFIVFIKNINKIENVRHYATSLIKAIHNLQLSGERKIKLSCSIGISLYPQDGEMLSELYRNSDYALYEAKNSGKNCFILYDKHKFNDVALAQYDKQSVISDKIDSNENAKVLSGKLVEYVFRILYKTNDTKEAVQTILDIVGMQFDVSRMYIFENIDNDDYCCNTFEWCNKGVEPEIQNLQHVSYKKDLGGIYWDNFNEEGIFYCRDIVDLPTEQYNILAPQGIKSLLQCAVTSNGVIKGYVGFDECRVNCYWTQEQIDVLIFIAEILSTFLLKERAEEQFRQESESLRAILDNQKAWIYVIDPIDYKLLFINKSTKEIVPKANPGTTCHEAFFNSKECCENCSANKVGKHCRNAMSDIYNPILDLWIMADSSYISWMGKDAIMLVCNDITRFKR